MAKKTIMVVDDEQDILKLVSDLLEPEGYRVIKAKSGAEALKKLKKTKADLLLVDFFMPRMSGRDLCEKIRSDSKLKGTKIAFMTIAKFSKSGIEHLRRMNVLDCIKKPFDNEDLVKRIKKLAG